MGKPEKKDYFPEESNQLQNKKLIAVSKWNNYYDFPTVGALRNLIFFADRNGIGKCIKKIGGRLYIEESAFFEWVDLRSNEEKKKEAC